MSLIVTELQSINSSSLSAAKRSRTHGEEMQTHCFHCGSRCGAGSFRREDRLFCCQGCLSVFELLTENGLTDFYRLDDSAGVKISSSFSPERFAYLDEPT